MVSVVTAVVPLTPLVSTEEKSRKLLQRLALGLLYIKRTQ